MKVCDTHKVEIYVGFREGYTDVYHSYDELLDICQKFCDCGLCLSIEPITFTYTDGREPGAKITLINYPRFPKTLKEIVLTASDLGCILLVKFKQHRLSIVTADKTFMLERENE